MSYDFDQGKNYHDDLDDKVFYKLLIARVVGIGAILAVVFAGMKCGEKLAKDYEQNKKQNVKQTEVKYFKDSLESFVQ